MMCTNYDLNILYIARDVPHEWDEPSLYKKLADLPLCVLWFPTDDREGKTDDEH